MMTLFSIFIIFCLIAANHEEQKRRKEKTYSSWEMYEDDPLDEWFWDNED